MTATIKLVQRDDFTGDISTLDLTSYNAGINLAENGYIPGTIDETTGHIFESLTLRMRDSSVDLLAADEQALANMVRLVGLSKNSAERYGVWLRVQSQNETKLRQAYILSAKHAPVTSPFSYMTQTRKVVSEYSFGYERMPYWEDINYRHFVGNSGAFTVSSVGGLREIYITSPGDLNTLGDQPARLSFISFQPDAAGAGPMTKIWWGLRSTQYSATPTNFQPYWSLEKGYNFDGDTTGAHTNADATAKDGYKTVTTFGTPTLKTRIWISATEVTANVADQRGQFKVLLRAKNSAAGTVRVRLGDFFKSSTVARWQPRVPITSTSWQFYDLGTVTIPSPGNLVLGTDPIANYALLISAQRDSGACNLECDCLVLIPYNEYSLYVPDGSVYYNGVSTFQNTAVLMRPDNKAEAYVTDNYSASQALSTPYTVGEGLPLGNVVEVIAAQRASSSVLADNIGPEFYFYQRWDQLRGNEG